MSQPSKEHVRHPATEQAEHLVDAMGERVNRMATGASRRLQTMTARVREQGEDFWAEVQHFRYERGAPHQQPQAPRSAEGQMHTDQE